MNSSVISVKQLNFYVKSLLEADARLTAIAVSGEISNFSNHYASGHWYFTLKDGDASIRCVMFKSFASKVNFDVKNGMQVVLRGRVSLYERDGQYQFYAEQMSLDGMGDIAVAFEQIKERLLAEGLFDKESKRPLPSFPERIAVITSPTGAAVQDIINILGRRNPMCEIVLCPVSVQGDAAVSEMLDALERVYQLEFIDLIIIGRGGGSLEDLWAFNSEKLARKIFESPIPVISAVGHETDFTICDFVADCRAPTPSAAAELAVPDISAVKETILKLNKSMLSLLGARYNIDKSRLSALMSSSVFRRPDTLLSEKEEYLDRLTERLTVSVDITLKSKAVCFEKLLLALDSMSPIKLLRKGYAVVEKNGSAVRTVSELKKDEEIKLIFADGNVKARII